MGISIDSEWHDRYRSRDGKIRMSKVILCKSSEEADEIQSQIEEWKKIVDKDKAQIETDYKETLLKADGNFREARECAKKARDETIAPFKKLYENTVEQANKELDNAIALAKKIRDETIAPVKKKYEESVHAAEKVNTDAIKQADKVHYDTITQAKKELKIKKETIKYKHWVRLKEIEDKYGVKIM